MVGSVYKNELIIAWLKDAYAMEKSIVESLEKQVDLASDHPEIQSGIQRHLEATKGHAESVKNCLSQLDESPSGIKTGLGAVGGKMQGMAMGAAKDDLVKAALQDYSTEHMEIASYKALIVGLEDIGLPTLAEELKPVLEDEIAMAKWLEQQLPTIVKEAVANVAA
jgi:ferritin-like metal-binding protein YciE